MASVLVPLATFAGGLTLATQFIIQCPGSRLEALLQMAAQLFLASPIVLLAVYLFLYQKADTEVGADFLGYVQHDLVVAQFVTAGFMIAIAFLLLGYALLSAQVGPRAIGIWGLVLLGTVMVVALISGVFAMGFTILQYCGCPPWRTADRKITARDRVLRRRLENVEEVLDAEQATLNLVPNPNSHIWTRVMEALKRIAEARADAILDQELDRLTTSTKTKRISRLFSGALVFAQLGVVGVLLAEGLKIVRKACVHQGCTPSATTDAKACASMVTCLSSASINPSPSPFTCPGTSPNATTLPEVRVNTTVTCNGDSNVWCISNDTVIISNDSNVATTLSSLISFSTPA